MSYERGAVVVAVESVVSPWAVVSLREIDVDRAVARVTAELTDTAAETLTQYVVE